MSDVKTRRRAVDKKDRVPFGAKRSKLQLSSADMKEFERRGRVVRWFNDQDGRIAAAIQGGWHHVDPENARSMGSNDIHQENTDLNSTVSKVVSRGTGPVIRAYLMEISKEFYDEDQASKEEVNARVDQAMRPADQGGQSIEEGYTPR
jgi:hypothetical protein